MEENPEIKRELFTLCDSAINGSLDTDNVLQAIRAHLEKDDSLASHLFDVLTGLSTLPLEGDHKENATRFFKAVANEFLPEEVLKLELPQLGADSFKSKIIKTKTKIYYKQLKFNLFREESEGYAKLVTEFLTIQSTNDERLVFERVSQLIGQFNLDPNRVVDILLDCFGCNFSSHRVFLRVLELFKIETDVLKRIVLLKFIMSNKAGHTSFSIYRVVVLLSLSGMLDIKEIFQSVQPTREQFNEDLKEQRRVLAQRIKKAETISTFAESSGGLNVPLNEGPVSNGSSNQIRSFSSIVYAQEVEDKKACGEAFDEYVVLGKNQKLGFLVAAAELGSLSLVRQFLSFFPEGYPLGSSKRFAFSLCQILDYIINPFYNQVCQPAWPEETNKAREWEENFIERPECMTSWDGLSTHVLPLLKILGPYVGVSRGTGFRFMRILHSFFSDENLRLTDNYDELTKLIYSIVDFCLLPSLSIGEPNFSYNEELWKILSRVPYQGRYWMYGRWKSTHSADNYELKIQRGKVIGRMKYIMKRMTKETVKVAGRQLGKVCLIHPTIAFDYMLERVQSFQNLIGPVVESMRFLSELSFDILAYSLIESLALPSKQGLKTSDGTLSTWLVALATFAGAVYRRYSVEYEGILQYVTNQMKDGKSVDLMILREVVTSTVGFEPISSLTADQLDALCSGDLLRQEVIGNTNQKGRKQAITRLREALTHTDLCESLAILLAQQKNCVLYKETNDAPVKLSSQMIDQCQETFIQFVNFLRSNIKSEEYVKRIPLISILFTEYRLPAASAFFLSRFNYTTKTLNLFDSFKKVEKETTETKKLDADKKNQLYIQALSEVLISIEEELCQSLPNHLWTNLSAKVYVYFWFLTASDIHVNVDLYNREIERIRKDRDELSKIENSKSRRAREGERLKTLEQKMSLEFTRQRDHVSRVLALFEEAKESFFSKNNTADSKSNQMISFIQYCLFPRCVFSEADAVYCAKFIILLHSLRTGFFTTLTLFDKIFKDVIPVLLSLSENESASFGRFISLILEIILKWHGNEESYNKECAGHPGCLIKLKNSGSFSAFDDYRTVCLKWQKLLCRALIQAMSEKSNYILTRNAFLLANRILEQFPLITKHVTEIEHAAIAVRDREKTNRMDLSVMAQSYLVHLKKRPTKTYEIGEFCPIDAKTPGETTTKRPTSDNKTDVSNGKSNSDKLSTKNSSSSEKKSSDTVAADDKKSTGEKEENKDKTPRCLVEKSSIDKILKSTNDKSERSKSKSDRSSTTRDKSSDRKPSEKDRSSVEMRSAPTVDKKSSSDHRGSANGRVSSEKKVEKSVVTEKKSTRDKSPPEKKSEKPEKLEKPENRNEPSKGSKRREPFDDVKQEPKTKRRHEKKII